MRRESERVREDWRRQAECRLWVLDIAYTNRYDVVCIPVIRYVLTFSVALRPFRDPVRDASSEHSRRTHMQAETDPFRSIDVVIVRLTLTAIASSC